MSDPTMQTSGPMISFKSGLPYVSAGNSAEIEYFPHDSPPPPWTEGQQWTNFAKGIPSQKTPENAGCAMLLVKDRSSQSIPEGKGYAFKQICGWFNVQSYFEIHGVAGGSTCLPGVGLYNLVTNPKAWTYFKPQEFNGTWEISWLSSFSVGPISLSITYAPQQSGFFYAGQQPSRLLYTFSSTPVYYPTGGGSDPADTSIELLSSHENLVEVNGQLTA